MVKLRVGFIGCGGRNRRGHMKYVSRFSDVQMVAVCDPVSESRDAAGDEYGIHARYSTIEEMLEKQCLDAVFVATPAHLNAKAARVCLEFGINTLLEKPPGMNVAETVSLLDSAERTGAKAMVGWNHRFHTMVVKARHLVEERGPIVQLVGEFHKSMSNLEQSGRFPASLMDNMLLESPIHSVDLIRALAGSEVVEVHSVVRRVFSKYKDIHAALILFENGCVAQITANYTTDARLQRYEIHGRDISVYLEGVKHGEVFCDGNRYELDEIGSGGTEEQARFFLDCVKDDNPVELPGASLAEAVKTMGLVESILSGVRE